MSKKLQELKKWVSLNITLTNLLPINTTCNVTTRLVDILEKDVDESYFLSESGYISKEKYGRMGKQAVETIKENMEEIRDGYTINAFNKTIDKSGLSPTLTTRPEGFKTAILPVTNNLRIRKLTPLECWRLQGFSDEQFYKAKNSGVSKSQLYKQAGNAVTVNVVDAIVGELE
ncbi:DNA cytosine methyltransferase [Staphylococcus haemolyticus]|uniref:DNA cytosine methyltransferase n=1 Tax=Staphylococcus haemolyticus TaxID=1283 RepID=UPI000754E9F7|nr:DNA cytosine methyltransferase [Staphylococcus haemolyticus]